MLELKARFSIYKWFFIHGYLSLTLLFLMYDLMYQFKIQDYKSAKTYFEKSMSEHRTPEVKSIISELEKKIKEEERKAYIDPVKAEEAKEKGNELFNKGNF